MEIGMVGLGKMGCALALHLKRQNFQVVGYDIQQHTLDAAEKQGLTTTASFDEFIQSLTPPRMVWMMLPAGKPTQEMVIALSRCLQAKDIVIDGGNSYYEDSLEHGEIFQRKGIHFFDVGTSGGIEGALHGGNFMIGGDRDVFSRIEHIFASIAQKGGYLYCGPCGSGHYLKMVHNGIEYGMMQAIGEGFDVLQHSPYDYDNEAVAKLWNHGSVIRSWLMELAAQAFHQDPQLEHVAGIMYSSGEGQWTVEEALKRKVAIPVIANAVMMRYRSLETDTFTGKVVASLRKGFGGHDTAKKD